uniref:Uncharacterized protein n=1 Tax=Sphaerodactylus townsendi TaxID=933632 RepID=A0ACB8G757_9SAUR
MQGGYLDALPFKGQTGKLKQAIRTSPASLNSHASSQLRHSARGATSATATRALLIHRALPSEYYQRCQYGSRLPPAKMVLKFKHLSGKESPAVYELKKEREHLEQELEKAEIERSTYVSEVRELKDLLTELQKKLDDSYSEAVRQNEELNVLKTQLNETVSKLKTDQNERQNVAVDLPKVSASLETKLDSALYEVSRGSQHVAS